MTTFTKATSKIVALLEALYDLEQPRDHWFRGAVKAASAALGRGAGVGMVLYRAGGDMPEVDAIDGVDVEERNYRMALEMHAERDLAQDILRAYRNDVCATLHEHVHGEALRRQVDQRYAMVGIRDQVLINGGNPNGFGCALYVFSHTVLQLRDEERMLFSRVASHLSTAYRLHRRLNEEALDSTSSYAVMRSDGRVEFASSAIASNGTLPHLKEALRKREWVRAGGAAGDDRRSTAAWKPMVSARWSLVDSYERNGVRHIVARENAPSPRGVLALSAREQQVISMAALGHSNKLIAYDLDLAHSTVRVLLARAAAKIGVRSRVEVIEHVRTRT